MPIDILLILLCCCNLQLQKINKMSANAIA